MQYWTQIREWLARALNRPVDQLNRWQYTARYTVAVWRYGAQKLNEDRASQMAAALTYRTIFGLIPLMVLGLVVFNAFGGFQQLGEGLQDEVYDYLGLSIAIHAPAEDLPAPPDDAPDADAPDETFPPVVEDVEDQPPLVERLPIATQPAEEREEVKQTVDTLLASLAERVSQVSFTSIGVVGLGVLIWAALALVVAVEWDFNRIFRAPEGRAWHLRITIYWAVVTLGPVFLAGSFYLTNQLLTSAETVPVLSWFVHLITPFFSLALTWLLLTLLYLLLPNTKVRLRAAVSGALAGAILWEASKWGFRLYLEKAVGYSTLYGSLGLIPLFLLWLYLTWLVVLFGLEIAYVVQTIRASGLLHTGGVLVKEGVVDHAWVVPVATAVGRAFQRGQTVTLDAMSRRLGLPPDTVDRLTRALVDESLIHPVDDEDGETVGYTLSKPAERIAVVELLNLGRSLTKSSLRERAPGATALERLRDSEEQAIGDRTLADVLAEERPDDEDAETVYIEQL